MLDFLHNAVLYVVPFLLVLTLVVTVHELGHFLVAKACGVKIDSFSIGFGKAIFSRRDKDGVQWRIGWIPLGGYVMYAGDTNVASIPDQDDLETLRQHIVQREGADAVQQYYFFKPVWQRALSTVAGPAANFLLAIVLFAFLLITFGEQSTLAKVGAITPGSVAESAGFKSGDLIREANGRRVETFKDLINIVGVRGGVPTRFVIERAGDRQTILATPRWTEVETISGKQPTGLLGIQSSNDPADAVAIRYNPIEALGGGVRRTWETLETSVYVLGRIIRGEIGANQIHGPLGIAKLSKDITTASSAGAPDLRTMLTITGANLLALAAALSVGIGFMNLLPVPVLDGGHLLFYAYEAVARRPLAAKVQAAGYRVGLALVLGLMLFATWNDLQQLSVFKNLGRLFS